MVAAAQAKNFHCGQSPPAENSFGNMKKYEDKLSDGRLLPVLSNQKLNSYLKEIADICGIKKNLTFHVARHNISTFQLKTNDLQNFILRQVTI